MVTFGLLAWVSMLRLAVLRRRSFDWLMLAVAAGTAIVSFTCFAFSRDDNANDWQANTGATLMFLCMFGTAVYFLVADIRRTHAERPGAWTPGYAQPNPYVTGPISGASGHGPGPGYPAGQAYAAPAPISGRTPPPAAPATAPRTAPPAPPRGAPTPTAGPRIDQVRAELDELSDYLRKEQGR